MNALVSFLAALEDITTYSKTALELTQGATIERLESDTMMRLAVERCLFIIGEAAARIRRLGYGDEIPDIQAIIGFRNLLAHEYHRLDLGEIWDVLQTHLPGLIEHVNLLKAQYQDLGDDQLQL